MQKEYQLPDPEKNPVACLTLAYKVTRGIDYADRSWDRIHWKRVSRAAKELLVICGSLRTADLCLMDIAKGFEDRELSWTLETVVKHAHDWVTKKHKGLKDGDSKLCRARLFKALADSRGSKTDDPLRKTSEEITHAIRGLKISWTGAQGNNGGPESDDHEENVDHVLPGEQP
jgi:hypothetical protein